MSTGNNVHCLLGVATNKVSDDSKSILFTVVIKLLDSTLMLSVKVY